MVVQGPLIGREPELTELEETLHDARLLTVTGAGGCGKTRLALELAVHVTRAERERRCVIAGLASVADEEQLLATLLTTLGARERFGSTPRQVLLQRIAAESMLLVLDNCEHLLASVRGLVEEILEAAPDIRVLTTSREPLQASAEHVFELRPLSVPDADDISAVVRSDAGQLFIDRATCAEPELALTPSSAHAIAEICRQLDGLPLAIVLAAARLDTLTVQEIASGLAAHGRLSTAPSAEPVSQHDSLRDSLDWSYRLLDEREQLLLRRLSVFSGGFSTSAAVAVAAPEAAAEDTSEIRGLLERLERKQLISRDARTDRWSLLQTVAEYAAERLLDAGESEQVADIHMRFFRGYALHADDLLLEADGHALIDCDRANLRLALLRALAVERSSALEIAGALMCDWILAEHYREARATCASILAVTDEQEDAPAQADASARAIVHCGAGIVAVLSQDYDGAIVNTRSGLKLAAEVSDDAVKARCLLFSATVLLQTGIDVKQGIDNAERAVQLARATDDRLGLAFALVNLAISLMLCGRFDAIERVYEEFLQIPQACEHPRLRTWAEHAIAWAHLNVGSLRQALEHTELALRLEGDAPSMTHFQGVGFRIHALARSGRAEVAVAEGAEALESARESGALMAIPAIELALTVAQFMHEDLDAADARARGLLDMPHLHTLALAHETLARIALMRNEIDEAHAQADNLETLAERFGSLRQRALADCIRGRAALQAGERPRARELLHAALETCAELRLHHDLADVLDELAIDALSLQGATSEAMEQRPAAPPAAEQRQAAPPAAEQRQATPPATESIERAARLAGAASAVRQRLGCIAGPDIRMRLAQALQAVDESGQGERWQTAWRQGQALTSAEAVAYARRGRGPRDRPQSGWESLTQAELKVAKLASTGLPNPQIAKRLFISRGTVKMHLANTYRKLQIANRTELAAAMARRASEQAQQRTQPGQRQASA